MESQGKTIVVKPELEFDELDHMFSGFAILHTDELNAEEAMEFVVHRMIDTGYRAHEWRWSKLNVFGALQINLGPSQQNGGEFSVPTLINFNGLIELGGIELKV